MVKESQGPAEIRNAFMNWVNEEDAIGLAELRYNEWKEAGINKPSLMESTTTLHNLIKEIRERTDHT